MSGNKFDIAVIGSGPGGYVAAIRCAQLGLSTAIIEKNKTFGGTCLNVGCIPSKVLLESTDLFRASKTRFKNHGILIDPACIQLDLKAMMTRKDQVVKKMTDGVGSLLKNYKIANYEGTGKLKNSHTVIVQDKEGKITEIESGKIILATGSVPVSLPGMPFDGDRIVDSTAALSFDKVPGTLAIIGAGAIGLEIGSIWSRLGSEVVIVEMMDQILPRSESGTSGRLAMILKKQGIDIKLSTTVKSVDTRGGRLSLSVSGGDGALSEISCDKVLVAAGRKPFTEGLGLDEIGVDYEGRSGRIKVGKNYETSIPDVFAIGDLIKGQMLAHKAEEEAVALSEYIAGGYGEVDYDTIPSIVYTWPEYASVGKSEDELLKNDIPYKTGRFQFGANGRALAIDSIEGFVKILSDPVSDTVLGAQILGPWASELIGEISIIMAFRGKSEDIARTVHAHPTLSEVLREASMDVLGWSIHSFPKTKR
jgi:dihydrolipoamide dehydrogenase